MTTDYLDDILNSDQSTVEDSGIQYPYIQWTNGKPALKQAGGIAWTGGWFLPMDNAPAELPKNWTTYELSHNTGDSTAGYAARDLTVAVIRSRFRWFYTAADGSTISAARDGYQRGLGMRGHLQALVGVRGLDTPYVLTMKGIASKEFETQLAAFDRYIIAAANANLRQKHGAKAARAPRYAFWLTLGPQRDSEGKPIHAKVGTGSDTSFVTLMASNAGTKPASPEDLAKRFVGPDLRAQFQAWYHEADEWVAQWAGKPANGTTPIGHWYADPLWKGKFDLLCESLDMDANAVMIALDAPTPFQFPGTYDEACLLAQRYAEDFRRAQAEADGLGEGK